jgi:hypothetical protein
MAFALGRNKIHCTNCHYEGSSKVKGTGCGMWLLWLGVVVLACFTFFTVITPVIAVIMFLWLLLKPAQHICPKCKNENPVPFRQWKKHN